MDNSNNQVFTIKSVQQEGLVYASLEPVRFGDWNIKASSCNHGGVLVICTNSKTLHTKIRYFDDEFQANMFIAYLIESEESE